MFEENVGSDKGMTIGHTTQHSGGSLAVMGTDFMEEMGGNP